MRTGLTALAIRELSARPGRSFVSTLGIAVGVGVLTLVLGLGLGARDVILAKVVQELPVDMVEVIPKTMDLGLFRVNTDKLFGAAGLDDGTVERLRALPEVGAVYPKLDVRVPMGARGGARLFGRNLYTDLFMTALPEELLAPSHPQFRAQDGLVPLLVSDQLLEIYNGSVASALGTPQLTPQTLVGFEFELQLGRSMMLGTRGAEVGTERAQVVGVSAYAMRFGVTVPMATGRRLLAKYGEPGAAPVYRGILVKARSAADVPAVVAAARGMGLGIDETAQRTSDMLTAATALASLVGLLVLLLAGLNIAHSFFASVSERRRELAILRAVGAKRRHLVQLVLSEAALLGLGGGLLGAIFGWLGARAVDALAGVLLPSFPFRPESFFLQPPWVFLVGFAAALSAALLGALLPALAAARAEVARSLAEG